MTIDAQRPTTAATVARANLQGVLEQSTAPTQGEIAGDYADLPQEMKQARRWIVWKAVPNADPTKKPRKVPLYADGGTRGATDTPEDQARMVSFDEALAALRSGVYTGLGFCLGHDGTGNYWQGVDLDDIKDHPGLDLVADDLPGYTEDSPSGKGRHAFGYGRHFLSFNKSDSHGIEAYSTGRYFTVTGEGAGIGAIACLADFVEKRLKPTCGITASAEAPKVSSEKARGRLDDDLLRDLRSALNVLRSDGYDEWISIGQSLKSLGDAGRGLWIDWSQTSEKWRPSDASRWEGFSAERTGYEAIFAKAQRAGWLNPAARAGKAVMSHWSANSAIHITPSSFEENHTLLESLTEKLKGDPQYPFREDVLRLLVHLEVADTPRFIAAKAELKKAKVVLRDLVAAMVIVRKKVKSEAEAARKAKRKLPSEGRVGQYEVQYGCIHRWKETNDGEVAIRLCNFDARIEREVLRDDGAQVDSFFTIAGKSRDGRPLGIADVAFAEFTNLAWVTKAWGNLACIEAGQSNRDHLRAAIQHLSGEVPRQTIYAHTGWRSLHGQWVYLHASGGISHDGQHGDIEVDAGAGHMRHYNLPSAGTVDDIKTSLVLLGIAPSRPEIGATLLAAIYRAPLAECAGIDVTLFLSGPTGAFKSEASGLLLQHFGRDFSARALPGNWADTITDLEMKGHAAKDAIFCVDDFKPNGRTRAEADRLHAMADRLFRGVGNGAGRGRRLANLKQRPDYPARGFVVASGEDLPRGQSCRARLVILDIRRGDIDKDRLTTLQQHGRSGAFVRAMSAYVSWLAPQLDQLKATLRDDLIDERNQAIQAGLAGHHDRVPDNAAQLMVGAKLLCRFAQDAGAIRDSGAMLAHMRSAIYSLAESQGEHLQDQDEIHRFFALLGSVLSSKRAHVLDINSLNAPAGYDAWGWQESHDAAGNPYAKPQGKQIGWLDTGNKLYLDPNTAFAEVARLAQEQGESFSISPNTLWKRLGERGLLLDRKEDKRSDGTPYLRNNSRRTIGGRRYSNLVCVLFSENPESDAAENFRTNRTNSLQPTADGGSSWSATEGAADHWSEKADQATAGAGSGRMDWSVNADQENTSGPDCGPEETQQPRGLQADWSDWSAKNPTPHPAEFEKNSHTPMSAREFLEGDRI